MIEIVILVLLCAVGLVVALVDNNPHHNRVGQILFGVTLWFALWLILSGHNIPLAR